MDTQLSLTGFESPDYQERQFLNSIFDQFKFAVEANGGNHDFLTYKSTKAEGKSTGYTAVYFHTFTAFRLHLRGKQHYIALPTTFDDLVPESYPQKQLASDPKYRRILVNPDHPIEFYTDFLVRIVGETVNRYPKEWDCCSRYMECSDAKTCIHPDKAFALACGYRKILNSGRIFYGKNRNID